MLTKKTSNNQLMSLFLIQANSNRRIRRARIIKSFFSALNVFFNTIIDSLRFKRKRRRGFNRANRNGLNKITPIKNMDSKSKFFG